MASGAYVMQHFIEDYCAVFLAVFFQIAKTKFANFEADALFDLTRWC
jgi:hypothetical protein